MSAVRQRVKMAGSPEKNHSPVLNEALLTDLFGESETTRVSQPLDGFPDIKRAIQEAKFQGGALLDSPFIEDKDDSF
jgi:hypothetical protein